MQSLFQEAEPVFCVKPERLGHADKCPVWRQRDHTDKWQMVSCREHTYKSNGCPSVKAKRSCWQLQSLSHCRVRELTKSKDRGRERKSTLTKWQASFRQGGWSVEKNLEVRENDNFSLVLNQTIHLPLLQEKLSLSEVCPGTVEQEHSWGNRNLRHSLLCSTRQSTSVERATVSCF